MGMAASQARYLSLTARKSNVEYQGQQINQERTTLATESANLYQQMLDLRVPTPPNTSDYYTTAYSMQDSGTNYTLTDIKATGSDTGAHVSWINEDAKVFSSNTLATSTYVRENAPDSGTFYYVDSNRQTRSTAISHVDPRQISADLEEALNHTQGKDDFYDPQGNLDVFSYTINQGNTPTTYYVSRNTYNQLIINGLDGSTPMATNSYNIKEGTALEKRFVRGRFDKAESGRYTKFMPEAGQILRPGEYSLSIDSTFDETAYNQAYQDYQYQKDQYEKRVDEINAQTSSVQQKDKSLELQLNQLDTEQNAIQTEMESVQKVIEKNVEDTFNIFA